METYRYETHKFREPLLPFIYHPRFERSTPGGISNWHKNIELLRCTEGQGYVREGADQYPLTPNNLHIVNADTLHSFGSEDRVVYKCLIIDNSFFTSNGIPIDDLYFQRTISDPAVLQLFDQIALAYDTMDVHDYRTVLTIRTRVLCLLETLCRQYITKRPASVSHDGVKKAITYMRLNLSRTITLDTLANHVGMSKFHLARQFKQFTGNSVIQTLNLMRCTQAQNLLREGLSVSAAARSCGFENLSYFTRTYQKHFHRLPSAET